MRSYSLLLVGPRRLEWVAEDLPPLPDDGLLVRTSAGAVSIGTELPLYCCTSRSSAPPRYPRMTGYESVGTVIACGPAVRSFGVGDRVVAFHGHRTHAVIPETRAIPVPDDMSDALALLVILSCDVAKGVRKLRPAYDEAVLVTGAGAIGLLTVFMLCRLGVRSVDVVEPRAERRALALRLGARAAVAPEEMAGTGRGAYAAGFECSARNAAFALLQSQMQRHGRICVLADGNVEPLVLAPAFHEQELTLVASSDGWDYRRHAAWYFPAVREGPADLQQLFQHRTSPAGLIDTFARLATGAIAPVKVLVEYPAGAAATPDG